MSVMKNQFKKSKISIWARHRKRFRLYSIFFPLFTLKRVVKQLSSTHPLFCWLLNSKHSLIRKEHHSLNAHINIHPTPLISFQNPVAYAIYWAVSEVLSNFSSWFSKPVSKKGKNLIHCLSIDWVLFLSPFWMWTGRKYLPSHYQRTEWQKYSTLSLWVWKGSRYSQSFPLSEVADVIRFINWSLFSQNSSIFLKT